MVKLHEYHVPRSVIDAVRLLTAAESRLAPLAGGASLVGQLESRQRRDLDGVVDLRKLGLNTITVEEDKLTIGATATLTDVVEHAVAGALAGGILRRAAKGEGPINLLNQATVGGIVATAAYDSEFYAALLALNATVTIHEETGATSTLPSSLGEVHGLMTAVTLPIAEARCGLARVSRTPSDRPIVAAMAVVGKNVERVAFCGVANRPVLSGASLHPPDNFKGSSDYRRALAPILMQRALAEARRVQRCKSI